MNAHLLVFDQTQVERVAVRDAIDGMRVVEDWTMFFGNTMCLASELDAKALSKEIQKVLPRDVRFLLTTIDPKRKGGWLPKSLWRAMNNPVPAH